MANIGRAIAVCRIQHLIRQKDLADKVGLSANYLCLIERGHRGVPIKTVEKIAEGIGISPLDIFVMAYTTLTKE